MNRHETTRRHFTGPLASPRSAKRGSNAGHLFRYSLAVLFLFAAFPAMGEVPPNLLDRAEGLYLKGRYAEAREMFAEAADENPIRAMYGEARCWQALGDRTAAVGVLRGGIDTHPKANDLRELLAESLLEQGETAETAALIEAMREAGHDSPRLHWLAARLAYSTGQIEQAERSFRRASQAARVEPRPLTLAEAEQLLAVGQATAQLAEWEGASEAYRELVQKFYPALIEQRPDFWPAHLELARLFAAKFNTPASVSSLHKALSVNGSAGEIYLLRARLAIEEFDLPSARRDIERALAANAELVEGYALLADCLLAEFQSEEAIPALGKARKLAPHSEAVLGRLAGAYRARDGAQRDADDSLWRNIVGDVTQRNPHCGEFYVVMAQSLDRMRKYPQAQEIYRLAEAALPERAHVEAPLGMLAMRLGQEGEAKTLLDEAFRIDPFHVRVKNSLEVLDVLSKYAVLETEHFVLRFDRGHDQVMAEAAAESLEEVVYPSIVERLGYEPPEKSLIEVFSKARNSSGHAWFSARMVGLPFIGTVGACAGKMAAIVSPNDGREFHWARVLRHEFVHVVNLQQTDFNIPHWYTEALAVWNEDRPRPPQWRAVLASSLRNDTLFDLDSINMGFIRPGSSGRWALAYCQAELYAEYLVQTYGPEALGKMLAAYRGHRTTQEALRECFDVAQADFEAGYLKYVAEVVANESPASSPKHTLEQWEQAAQDSPDDADTQAGLALAQLQAGRHSAARESAAAALKIEADHALAAYVIAALLVKVDRAETAREFLTGRLHRQQVEPHSLWLLATLAYEAEDYAAAEGYYRLGHDRIPAARKWLTGLEQVYQKTGDLAGKLWLLQVAAERDEDNFELRKQIVTLAEQLGEEEIAGRFAEDACYINPQSAELWAIAARWHSLAGRYAKAARRYQWALHLEPGRDAWRLAMTRSMLQNQDYPAAAAALAPLTERKPNDPEVQRLQKEIDRGPDQ